MVTDALYEKELLQRIAQGDEAAFRIIFDHYKERFYAAAIKMTRSADTAEEIVQEVFITLWLRRGVLASVETPASYLFAIVYNNIYAHFKKLAVEKKMKQGVCLRISDTECPTEDRLIDKENQQLLQSLIQQLPPQQQSVYKLSKLEGLSRGEIAERLHISPNTVKNHLQEAVKFIRVHFSKTISLLFSLLI